MATETAGWDERLERDGRNAFDAVRLALASLVLLEHSCFLVDGNSARDPLSVLTGGQTNFGQFSVFMFFSLSGFLVTASLSRSKSTLQFLFKRASRIVPGFLLATLLACLIVGPLTAENPGNYLQDQNWLKIIVSSLALKQIDLSHVLANNQLHLVHGTLWTIKYEFDCYIILAALGAAGLLREKVRNLTYLVLATSLAISMWFGLPAVNYGIASFLISSPAKWPQLFPFFLAGSAFFVFRQHVPKRAALLVIAIGMMVGAGLFGGIYWALLTAGTYSVLYIALSRNGEIKIFGRPVDISYGVYLYGWPVQQVILFYFGPHLSPVQLFVAAIPITYLIALLSWLLVERPSLQFVRSRV